MIKAYITLHFKRSTMNRHFEITMLVIIMFLWFIMIFD